MAESKAFVRAKIVGRGAYVADAKSIERSTRGIGHGAGRASRGMRGLGRASRMLARGVGTAAVGAGVLAAVVGKRSVSAYEDARKVTADQEQALKTTGAQSWITAGQLDEQAAARMRATAVDDEAIKKSQTLLTTFRNVRNEAGKGNKVFDRAGQAALDLSARFDKGLGPSTTMVGKALEDPVKGVTALTRVGVSFKDQQRDQIKALVESGRSLEAQRLILRELETQVGGAAAAQATATDKMKTAWGEVEEGIGKGLSPVVDAAAGKLLKLGERAAPLVDEVGNKIQRVFERKDLSGGQKIQLSFEVAKKGLRPLTDDLRAEVGRMDLGDKLGSAVERAAPRMADAMASQVPRMVSAFARAFVAAGPGGQLLTAGLLLGKFGAFGAVAKIIGGGFSRVFAGSAVVGLSKRRGMFMRAGTTVGTTTGVAAGTSASATMAATTATRMPVAMAARAGKFRAVGIAMGRIFGLAAAAVVAYELGKKLEDSDSWMNAPSRWGESIGREIGDVLGTNRDRAKERRDAAVRARPNRQPIGGTPPSRRQPPRRRPGSSSAPGGPSGTGGLTSRGARLTPSPRPTVDFRPNITVTQNDRGAWRANVRQERREQGKR